MVVLVSVLSRQPKRKDLPLTERAMDNHRINGLKYSEVVTHQDYALLSWVQYMSFDDAAASPLINR